MHSIARLTVFARAFCHTCVENLLKRPALVIISNSQRIIQLIKNYATWNGYPKGIVNSILKQALWDKGSNNITEESTAGTVKVFIDLKFSGNTIGRIVENCMKKLKMFLKRSCHKVCVLLYNIKDKTPVLNQSSVVYKFFCP